MFAVENVDVQSQVVVDSNFYDRYHNLEEIKKVLNQFDTYDFVRTKNQKEELIRYLIGESERLNYSEGIAKGKNILGVLLRDRAEYAKAIVLHESALRYSGSDTLLNIYSLNNLGVVYRRLDKPRIALDYHMKALQLAEHFEGDKEMSQRSVCVALNSIGNIHLTLKQPEKALEVFNKTLKIEKSLQNHLGMAINFQNIGYAYEAMENFEVALEYYKKSLDQNQLISSDVGRSICYNSIGDLMLKENRPNNALNNFEMAMQFAQKTNDDYYISQTHANIGKAYLYIGDMEKAFPQLIEYQKKALKINSGYLMQDSYKLLSTYYEKKGEFYRSLDFYKKAVQYNDSIVNEKNSRYLNELQTLYDAEKQKQQIELLTIENQVKTQQNYFYLFAVILAFLVVIVFYISAKRRSDKQKTELESKLFRSLMNPHFIFNALGSIQSFLYHNEAQKAATYLGHFSKLSRSILKNSNKELIPLVEELETLKNYIEIEQMRKRDSFKYEIEIDNDVELDFIYVLPTMLQPFAENAIHHGLVGPNLIDGLLKIEIRSLKKYVRIVISDNGQGINYSNKKIVEATHKSMGLSIFRERIRLIERKFKKTVKFVITDLKEKDPNLTGTMVVIDFPLIEPND